MGLGPHRGLDYSVPVGTPLKAVASGTIVKVYETRVLGHVIELRCWVGDEDNRRLRIFAYCHLDKADIKVGKKVRQGEVIGLSGNSGTSSGAHLHLMCGPSEHLATMPVEDPLKYLPKIGKK